MVPLSLEEMIPPGHPVRVLGDLAERLDLSRFTDGLKVSEGQAGRSATDVRLLVALWLYAATQGVGSARELERLCEHHAAYRWLCGGVHVNYHTLSDFRVSHEEALDDLMTEVMTLLMARKLVSVHRISQDGLRVRASAGKSRFRREQRLQGWLDQAKGQGEALKAQREAPARTDRNARQAAARERAARERLERVQKAIGALEEIKKIKARARSNDRDKPRQARASTTDSEARVMKMPEGGFVKLEQIQAAEQAGVCVYAPPQGGRGDVDPCQVRKTDSPEIAAWRTRMAREEGKSLYKERASTSETVNADLRTYRGLGRLLVRGLRKVRCVTLWSALAYNLMHLGEALLVG
jgi:transposase